MVTKSLSDIAACAAISAILPVMPTFPTANANANANAQNWKLCEVTEGTTNNERLATNNWKLETPFDFAHIFDVSLTTAPTTDLPPRPPAYSPTAPA
jgi:hypothetical protein